MCLPASIACVTRSARICVVAASKNTVSVGFFSAAARSVVERATPYCLASAAIFSALRPTRIGSGITRSPFGNATPPWLRMAMIERTRCWFSPMRPVTPFMMMPSVRVATPILPTACLSNCLVTYRPPVRPSSQIVDAESREPSRLGGIDRFLRDAPGKQFADLPHGVECLMLDGGRREACGVWRRDHVGAPGKIERWLLVKGTADIHGGPGDLLLVQRGHQRGFVHQIAALQSERIRGLFPVRR